MNLLISELARVVGVATLVGVGVAAVVVVVVVVVAEVVVVVLEDTAAAATAAAAAAVAAAKVAGFTGGMGGARVFIGIGWPML